MEIQEIILYVTLGTVLINIVLTWNRKNNKQDIDLVKVEKDVAVNCSNIKKIEEHLGRMSNSLILLKENDMKHIEERVTEIDKTMVRIETTLKERLPSKSNGLKI